MLEDLAITPASVRWISPCGNQSWIGGPRRQLAGHDSRVRGVTLPSLISELSVSTFSTEPGS